MTRRMLQFRDHFRFTRLVLLAGLLSCATAAIGCAAGHPYLKYEPASDPPRIAEPQSPPVTVEVSDHRTDQDMWGAENALGEKLQYVPANNMAGMLKEAFATELKNRGYVEKAGGSVVLVTLSFYQANRINDNVVGRSIASIGMQVEVKRPDGSIAFSRFILGKSEPWVHAHPSGYDFEPYDQLGDAAQAAMQQGLAETFSDRAFVDALNS
jgi:uncharacterized lipoprotein YajG